MENNDNVLNENLMALRLHAVDKEAVLSELAGLLGQYKYLANEEDYLEDVLSREKNGSTAIGFGLALPHGESAVLKSAIAIGISKQNIQWETPDGLPVRAVVLLAINNHQSARIQQLQRIVSRFADEKNIDRLIRIKSKRDVIRLLTDSEQNQ